MLRKTEKKNTEDLRPDRAVCSQVACTFKYATLQTRETHDTVTLKTVKHNIQNCTLKS